MMIDIEVQINPSFYKKVNHQIVEEAKQVMIKNTTLKAEGDCKKEAPYRTGNLRRSHSSDISDDEGLVQNSAHYVEWVVHGSSKMEGNNYPQRVANELSHKQFMSRTFKNELKKRGAFQ